MSIADTFFREDSDKYVSQDEDELDSVFTVLESDSAAVEASLFDALYLSTKQELQMARYKSFLRSDMFVRWQASSMYLCVCVLSVCE
jgi:predicted AlkP superfamily pyrophosphatase or phosphodiesterase